MWVGGCVCASVPIGKSQDNPACLFSPSTLRPGLWFTDAHQTSRPLGFPGSPSHLAIGTLGSQIPRLVSCGPRDPSSGPHASWKALHLLSNFCQKDLNQAARAVAALPAQ